MYVSEISESVGSVVYVGQAFNATFEPSYRALRLTVMRGGIAQWVARLTRNLWMSVSPEFEPH